MAGTDLMDELQRKLNELEISVKKLRKTGTDYAEAERSYKVTLRKEALKLRDEGMAVGMIDKVVYGVQEVADARFKRDVAEAVKLANTEHINATKLYIRIIEEMIEREWGQAK